MDSRGDRMLYSKLDSCDNTHVSRCAEYNSVPKYELYSEKSGSRGGMNIEEGAQTLSLPTTISRTEIPQKASASVLDTGMNVQSSTQTCGSKLHQGHRFTHAATQTLTCVGTQTDVETNDELSDTMEDHRPVGPSLFKPSQIACTQTVETNAAVPSSPVPPSSVHRLPLQNTTLLSSLSHHHHCIEDGCSVTHPMDSCREAEEYGRHIGSLMTSALLRAQDPLCDSPTHASVPHEQRMCHNDEEDGRCKQCTKEIEK